MGMRHLLLFMVSDTSDKMTMKKKKLYLGGENNVLFTSLKLLNLGSLFLISPVTYLGLTRHWLLLIFLGTYLLLYKRYGKK